MTIQLEKLTLRQLHAIAKEHNIKKIYKAKRTKPSKFWTG